MKKIFFLLLVLLPLSLLHAQERKRLDGKVTSEADDLEGIYVINKTADITIATSKGGYFSINVHPGDTLIFSAIQFIAKQVIVEQVNIEAELFFVNLEPMVSNLDEVVISKSNITSESLGLVPKGQKRYTSGERKVFTATDGVDGLFNAISGRSKMLKKAAEYEQKERLMEKINYIYTEEDIINTLGIPEEYVRGFVYYIVEDKKFAEALKTKNDTEAKILIGGLAIKYLEVIDEESTENVLKPDEK